MSWRFGCLTVVVVFISVNLFCYFWLFMRASLISKFDSYVGGLKLILGNYATFGLPQFRCLALPCSSFVVNDIVIPEETYNLIPEETHNVPVENGVEELIGLKSIIVKHGCHWGFTKNGWRRIDLEGCNIVQVLNDLLDGGSNAALSLYLTRLSESYTNSRRTDRSVCTMIHILVSVNMNHRAVDLVKYLVEKQNGSEERHDILINVLKETQRDGRSLATVYGMLVNTYIRENMLSTAIKLVGQMKILHMFPTIGVCNSLLKALLGTKQISLTAQKEKQKDWAWEILEDMRIRGMVNTSIFSLFIHHYCIEDNIDEASRWLLEMVNSGYKPDVVAFTIIINALSKKGLLEEATSLLSNMIHMGVRSDYVAVSSLIDGYCKARRFQEAMDIFKISGFSPNIFVYTSFISELCRNKKMVEATRLFREMSELKVEPDCCTYTTIIDGYCKVNELVLALQYLGDMLKRGYSPTTVTYSVLIHSYCKIGNLEMAEKLFHMVTKDDLQPDVVTYNILMDGYGKNGHMHKAIKLLDMMKHVSPDAATYNTIIHCLARNGFVKESRDCLEDFIRKGLPLDVLSFTNVISGLSKEGRFREAIMWFDMIEKLGITPNVFTCSALLCGYCKAQRMEVACALFHKMLESGLDPDIVLYNTLINGYCSEGNISEACDMIEMMVRHGVRPNHVTYGAVVRAFEKNGVLNPAEYAARKMQKILRKYGINED